MHLPEKSLTDAYYLVTYTVGPGDLGSRLDAFLKTRYRKRSREQIQAAILDGSVTLERNPSSKMQAGKLKPALQLFPGDRVLVRSERKPEPDVDFGYKILFEDSWLFVIDKPPNLPVHPAGRYFFNTLLTHLRTSGGTRPMDGDSDYYLPHRLDKETSGVLVLTKTSEACARLVTLFYERKTQKRYLAIVHGRPAQTEFEIDAPLRRSRTSPINVQMEVAPNTSEAEGGLTALTRVRVLDTQGGYSLVECHPKSGRQHQIRVHLAHAGCPIVGDKLYGMPVQEALAYYERKHLSFEAQARLILPRHALHAAGLAFEHPMTGEKMEFEAELPRDLAGFFSGAKA